MADQSSTAPEENTISQLEAAASGTGFKKCARLEPLCHVTATEPVADNLASVPISKSSGQIEFVYENPGADSLQFDEPIRLYPCTLCHVKCRRPYDLERHKQTKHDQSEHWFCPIDTCKLSRAVPGLSEALDASDLSFSVYRCRSYRRPLAHEVLHAETGCIKLRLHGFSRKDKLTKHLRKVHQEDILLFGAAPYGKGRSHAQSLICEIQRFWVHCGTGVPDPGQKWSPTSLCRSQVDGKWSEFLGRDLKAVAEAGFRRWTKDDEESYYRLLQAHDVLPWKAHDLILELGDDAPPFRTALEVYQMQFMLLVQRNKKRLMMARQEQDNDSRQPQGPSILDPAAKVQHQSMGHEAAVSDGSDQPEPPPESSVAKRSIPASLSGFEDRPWSTTITQAQSLPDMGVEGTFAAFDWEAFLNSDLSPGIDIQALASDHADVSAFDINGPEPSFDFNNSALNNAAATEFDFDFNDPSSLPDWYFSAENGAEPDV